jgi:hypothetical protein
MNVDRSFKGGRFSLIKHRSQSVAGDYTPGRPDQVIEDIELDRGNLNILVMEPYLAGPGIDADATRFDNLVLGVASFSGPLKYGSNAGQQFGRIEWLREIVVCTRVETADPVGG